MPIEAIQPERRSLVAHNQGRVIVHVVTGDGRIRTVQWAANLGNSWLVADRNPQSSKGPNAVLIDVRPSKKLEGAKLLIDHYKESNPDTWEEDYLTYLEWDDAARSGRVGSIAHGNFSAFPEDRLPESVLKLRKEAPDKGIFVVPPRSTPEAKTEAKGKQRAS